MVQAHFQPLTLSAPPGVPEGFLLPSCHDTTPPPKATGRAAESVTDAPLHPLRAVAGYYLPSKRVLSPIASPNSVFSFRVYPYIPKP